MNSSQSMRESNMEAMRIFSMLLVLIVHCCFLSNGTPNYESVHIHPLQTFWYTLIDGLSVPCVNCFILISGFFGIKVKLKSVFKIIFIVCFWYFTIWGIYLCFGSIYDSTYSLIDVIKSIQGNWFVWSYLGLVLLSPLLNLFVQYSSKSQLCTFLFFFFSIELLYVIYPFQILYFTGGYSAESFIGLYLLAAFYRKYYYKNKKIFNRSLGSKIYFGSVLLSSVLFFLCTYFSKNDFLNNVSYSLFSEYSSFPVIFAAFGVLIFFSRLNFLNKIINWLGASAFSVYIIHINPNIFPYFEMTAQWLYQTFSPLMWTLLMILFSIGVYLVCTLLDQLRIITWKGLLKVLDSVKYYFLQVKQI